MAHTIAIDARKAQDFGIGTYICHLVRGLAELDQQNRYLLLVGAQGQEVLGPLPENFRCVVERSPVYSLRELVKLSWRLHRLRADLYHATHYVLPAIVPCRAIVTIHDIIHLLFPDFLPSPLAFLYAQRMIRHSLSRGDAVLTVSQNTKNDLVRHFEVEPRHIEVVYNGVDDAFRAAVPADVQAYWRSELELPPRYLLFVGNPKPHKNLDNVIKAFARARQIHPFDAPLVCVGARTSADFKIRMRAEQLGISDAIRLVGHVPQEALPAIYRGASLFLYPTLYEGFGLPVLEAMASGTPVVTSNTSALKELSEGYAHLVNPLDVEGMAQAIAHCMADESHRASLAKLGARRAAEFSWQRTARRTLEVYNRVLQTSPGDDG